MNESLGTLKEQMSQRADYSENRELILLAQGEDYEAAQKAMEKLIELNRGLIRSIVFRFRDRGCDLEDLMQVGTIGMIKAVRSFDHERGTCFSTYAVPLIFGEVRRHLRDEGPIKVGRYYKKLGAMLMSEKNRIMGEEGREARISELAQICGVSVEEAAVALDSIAPVSSLSDLVYGEEDGMALEDTLSDPDAANDLERILNKIALGQAVSRMPSEWQKIVVLRYYRNYTQQQTADQLGLSQVKISREEKKILEFLRGEIVR